MIFDYLKYYKLFTILSKPIDGTINMMELMNAKLDAMAISKLQGQIRMLQRIFESESCEKTTLSICLSSLSESSEYFKKMTDLSFKTFEKKTKYFAVKGLIDGLIFKTFTSKKR